MASEELSFVDCDENAQSSSQRNIFSVPAVLSRSPNLENSEEYVLLFMCQESQKSAILKPAFLTVQGHITKSMQ